MSKVIIVSKKATPKKAAMCRFCTKPVEEGVKFSLPGTVSCWAHSQCFEAGVNVMPTDEAWVYASDHGDNAMATSTRSFDVEINAPKEEGAWFISKGFEGRRLNKTHNSYYRGGSEACYSASPIVRDCLAMGYTVKVHCKGEIAKVKTFEEYKAIVKIVKTWFI